MILLQYSITIPELVDIIINEFIGKHIVECDHGNNFLYSNEYIECLFWQKIVLFELIEVLDRVAEHRVMQSLCVEFIEALLYEQSRGSGAFLSGFTMHEVSAHN